MLFVGDVHGYIGPYKQIISSTSDCTLQVGDMGLGFKGIELSYIPSKDMFIRGNHDGPAACKRHPNYLGDWGYLASNQMFFVSGAWSIDKECRIPGISWWPEEELHEMQLKEALKSYTKNKPTVMVTHDCPTQIRNSIFRDVKNLRPPYGETRTSVYLQRMLEQHVPRYWVFGHHHLLHQQQFGDCLFVCVDELSTFSIPALTWDQGI